jgi:hypothetical protein
MKTMSLSMTSSDVEYLWPPQLHGQLNHPIGCLCPTPARTRLTSIPTALGRRAVGNAVASMAGSGDDEAALTGTERGRQVAGGGITHDHGARPGAGVVHVGGPVRARSSNSGRAVVARKRRAPHQRLGFALNGLRVPRVSREDPPMARNEIVVGVAPDEMFTLLLDPYAYPKWVVGTRRVRGVDRDWPRVGARFHHTVGVGPFSTRDSTRMLASRPPFDLDLEARFRPLGVAGVSVRVSDAGVGRCRIVLTEDPIAGPAEGLRGRAWDAVVHARNALSLWRLRRLAESRPREWGHPDRRNARLR